MIMAPHAVNARVMIITVTEVQTITMTEDMPRTMIKVKTTRKVVISHIMLKMVRSES